MIEHIWTGIAVIELAAIVVMLAASVRIVVKDLRNRSDRTTTKPN